MDKTGIEFMESMSRLIYKNKIVGYEHFVDGELCHTEMDVNEVPLVESSIRCMPGKYIHHDSFNKGIKVGDEFLFSGDRFEVGEHYIGDSRIKPFTGVLIFTDECCWEIENPKDSDFNLDIWQIISGNVKYKKIGNIYD